VSNFTEDQNGFQINMNASTSTFIQTVGIEPGSIINNIHLGPNPTNGLLNVSINSEFVIEMSRLQIIDLHGKIIYTQTTGFSNEIIVDLSNQAAGLYFLQMNTLSG